MLYLIKPDGEVQFAEDTVNRMPETLREKAHANLAKRGWQPSSEIQFSQTLLDVAFRHGFEIPDAIALDALKAWTVEQLARLRSSLQSTREAESELRELLDAPVKDSLASHWTSIGGQVPPAE